MVITPTRVGGHFFALLSLGISRFAVSRKAHDQEGSYFRIDQFREKDGRAALTRWQSELA